MSRTEEEKAAIILNVINKYPDFPKRGIVFYDMMPIMADPAMLRLLTQLLCDRIRQANCDVIVGLDAKGFLIGPLCALELGLPFIPIRKHGKLPGEVYHVEYKLEYGEDAFEMQKEAVKPGERVAIVDDLLATGGSMAAACSLVKRCGAEVVLTLVVIHLTHLNGTQKLPANTPFQALIPL